MDDRLITLAAGAMRLGIAPGCGGAIAFWRHGDVALLRGRRPAPNGAQTVRDYASYPLIPFSNRIGAGRFSFGGEDFQLPRDERDPRHALHGNALYAAWEVMEERPSQARLRLRYVPGAPDVPWFPFAYEAEQSYRLSPEGLEIGLSLRNTGARVCPAGFGHHLYFPRHEGAVLRFNAAGYWTNGPDGLPRARAEDLRAAFAAGEAVGARVLDHCFYGWDGAAEIAYPAAGYGLRLHASAALRHAVLFTPEGRDFFAFEPVSHSNDAINRVAISGGGAMRCLAPGEEMTARIAARLLQA